MKGHAANREWPFVARAEELELMARVIADGRDHPTQPAGAVIVAEAGVGKTRLVREALAWAEEHGQPTAWAIATRSAATTPFAALSHVVPEATFDAYDDAPSLHRALTVHTVTVWTTTG